MLKSAIRPINNSKNKLNNEIILIFNLNSNTQTSKILFFSSLKPFE